METSTQKFQAPIAVDPSRLMAGFVDSDEVMRTLGVSLSTITRLEERDGFPPPVKLGRRQYYNFTAVRRSLLERAGGDDDEIGV